MNRIRTCLFLLLLHASCSDDSGGKCEVPDLDFRQEMRMFVQGISDYAKGINSDFLIIPQNGQEILTQDSDPNGLIATAYVNAIDAVGREDLFYGYTADNVATPVSDRDYLISFCDIAEANGKLVMVTDYCSTPANMDDSYTQNESLGYISFAADHRELDNVPSYPSPIHAINASDILSTSDVKNFLYLINPSAFSSKQAFLDAVIATDYDLVLIDLYYDDLELTSSDIASLKTKNNGGTRLVVCYMSIGEAEDYRYYWNALNKNLVCNENPNWPGNYIVKYWEADWKSVIFGSDQSYTHKIISAGFDGVYLDIIEAYESFE